MQEIINKIIVQYDINIYNTNKRIEGYNQTLTSIILNIENETDFWNSINYYYKLKYRMFNKFSEKTDDIKNINLKFLCEMQSKFKEIKKDNN